MREIVFQGKRYCLSTDLAKELNIRRSTVYKFINEIKANPLNPQPIYPDPEVNRCLIPIEYLDKIRELRSYQLYRPQLRGNNRAVLNQRILELEKTINDLKTTQNHQQSISSEPLAPLPAAKPPLLKVMATDDDKRVLNHEITALCCSSPFTRKSVWQSITDKFGKVDYYALELNQCLDIINYVRDLSKQYQG